MAGLVDSAAFAGIGNGIKDGIITGMTIANQKQQMNMALALNGLEKDENGNLVPTAQKQQTMDLQGAQNKRQLGLLTSGSPESLERVHGLQQAFDASIAGDKTYHGPHGTDIFPETMSGASAEDLAGKGLIGKDVSGLYGMLGRMNNPMAGVREKGLGVQEHEGAVKAVTENKTTQNLLSGYQSMQNALTEYQNNPSPQSFHTLQNVMRMNAGSNNRSGVNERADQYATDTGIKKDELVQFLTGNMSDVNASSPEMVKAIMKVMDGELELKRKQAAQQIGKNKKAQEVLYNNSESQKYKPAFDSAVEDQFAQFDLKPDGTPVVSPGLIGQQDPQVASFAKQNGLDYAHAEKIIATRKAKMGIK